MNDQWTNRLSEYIDGELDKNERAELERTSRPAGSATRRSRSCARWSRGEVALDHAACDDLWPQHQGWADHGPAPVVNAPARRFSFSIPQLLAASIALVLLSVAARG